MYIEDYAPPTLRERPTHFIFHVGANDIPIKEDPDEIANNIANLATKLKRNCDVSVSGTIARNNQYQWKAADANQKLEEKWRKKKRKKKKAIQLLLSYTL